MRRSLAAAVLPLALAACGDKGPDDAAQYRDTVRCTNAAAAYAQQYVVAGDANGAIAMQGYADELKARAFTLGGRLGTPTETIRDETKGANDTAYLHKFFTFAGGVMTPTDFSKGEIAHCNLGAVGQ